MLFGTQVPLLLERSYAPCRYSDNLSMLKMWFAAVEITPLNILVRTNETWPVEGGVDLVNLLAEWGRDWRMCPCKWKTAAEKSIRRNRYKEPNWRLRSKKKFYYKSVNVVNMGEKRDECHTNWTGKIILRMSCNFSLAGIRFQALLLQVTSSVVTTKRLSMRNVLKPQGTL